MHLKMRNGNVAIELLAPQEKTSGGIYIPTNVSQGKLQYGKIVEAGPGELVQGQFVDMDLKKGDEVIFDSSRTEQIEIEGIRLHICNMVDIIATVNAKHLSVIPGAKQV